MMETTPLVPEAARLLQVGRRQELLGDFVEATVAYEMAASRAAHDRMLGSVVDEAAEALARLATA